MKEVGTLKELGVRVGDVVEWPDAYPGTHMTVESFRIICEGVYAGQVQAGLSGYGTGIFDDEGFRIISRAPQPPKLWRDMTPEERGALLLAAHDGKVIEYWKRGTGGWAVSYVHAWSAHESYRIRPDPKVETVTIYAKPDKNGDWIGSTSKHHTHKAAFTFTTRDGKPDCASVKMEAIE